MYYKFGDPLGGEILGEMGTEVRRQIALLSEP